MVKGILKYFIFLSTLLISGFYLVSGTSQASTNGSIKKSSIGVGLGVLQSKNTPIIRSASSIPSKRNGEIYDELAELEEVELLTSKKYLAISKYFINSSADKKVDYFVHFVKNGLPYENQFSHFSSYTSRNIIFEVFRI